MIEIKNLTKNYGSKTAIDNISFSVSDGEILGFLGPNGAGKSTTMNIITGYLSSSSGTVTVNGKEILDDPMGVKSQIGYLPEQPPLYMDMTVREYLYYLFELKKIKLNKKEHIAEICNLVGISDMLGRRIANLSKGYKQRVGLAQALLGHPPVLILDEATVGLDPKQMLEIRSLIKDLGKNHTIILSSHILSEVNALCDRVLVISNGTIVADDSPENLSRKLCNHQELNIRVQGDEDNAFNTISKLKDVESIVRNGSHEENSFDFTVIAKPNCDVRLSISQLSSKIALLEMTSNILSLEDIFLQLTIKEGEH